MNKTTLAVLTQLIPTSPVLTTGMAAAAAAVSGSVASRDLGHLADAGVLTRIVPSVWADVRHPDFSPYAVVPSLLRLRQADARGYVSLLSALNLRGMVQQIPRVMQIITTEHRRPLRTPVGTFEFHQIDPALFGGFVPFGQTGAFDLATPEKALFDVLYLSVRRANRFQHLPELELPRGFRERALESWIQRIPYPPVRVAVAGRWRALRESILPARRA